MTEEEAKEKLCCGPEGTGIGGATVGFHNEARQTPADPHYQEYRTRRFCAGAACMAWRPIWAPIIGEIIGAGGIGHMEIKGGYCGLAGKP